jgi:hypothetical protein
MKALTVGKVRGLRRTRAHGKKRARFSTHQKIVKSLNGPYLL